MDLRIAVRLPGTMWQGLDLDEAPEQGASPRPFLTLRQLQALPLYCGIPSLPPFPPLYARPVAAASLPARSDEGARTDSLPATLAEGESGTNPDGFDFDFDLGFSDLRRCSTADQSGVPDFKDSSDGH